MKQSWEESRVVDLGKHTGDGDTRLQISAFVINSQRAVAASEGRNTVS